MDFGFKVGGGVTMGFKPGGSATFGFDVGGSYVPPEPGEDVGVLMGVAALVFSGSLTELTDIGIISGTAEMEE